MNGTTFYAKQFRSLEAKELFFVSIIMRKIIFFILTGLFSCQPEKKPDAFYPGFPSEEATWMVYEGRVPLSEKSNLYIEVSVLPSPATGEGSFELKEYVETAGASSAAASFKGKYSTLYGETPGERMLQFHHSARDKGVTRSYLTPGYQGGFTNSGTKMIREELFRTTDLVVKIQGKNKLLVLDGKLQPLSLDAQANLTRRASKLFTVEGYFRHNGDTGVFVEMNTGERWPVSKLGQYHQAISQYYQLTKAKFEVTHLKAVGYSIRHTNKEGKEIDALVFKRILQMTSSPELTGEYNPLPQ